MSLYYNIVAPRNEGSKAAIEIINVPIVCTKLFTPAKKYKGERVIRKGLRVEYLRR